MNLITIDDMHVLNLDSVASISWKGEGARLVAVVKYLMPAAKGTQGGWELVSEEFAGESALALKAALKSQIQLKSEPPMAMVEPDVERKAEENAEASTLSFDPLALGGERKKAWYFMNHANGNRYFLAMVNMKGSCSMRSFDASTGRFLRRQYAHGDFQDQFARYLTDAQELIVQRQPNLERDCKEQLPPTLLADLKSQVSQKSPG